MPDSTRDAATTSVRVEQMRMLLARPLPGMLMATAFAFALAWQLRGAVGPEAVRLWLVLKVATVLPRIVHALLFRHRGSSSLVWLHGGLALLLLDGLSWGSAGWLLVHPQDQAHMTVVAASLSGIAVLGAFAIQADWRACVAFVAPCLLPLIVHFAARGDAFGMYGALSLSTLLVLVLSAAKRVERHVVELLYLRYHNAELTAELVQALAAARKEGAAKDAFLATMSHELRTPLHGILGLSRHLSGQVDEPAQQSLALIRRSGEHLLGLINNVLEVSRFRDRGFELNPAPVDLHGLIAEVVAICQPQAAERRLNLSADIRLPQPCPRRLDPYRVRQVLLNLLGNAMKFTNPGDAIVVQARLAEGDRQVVIAVTDTGIGIAPQAQAIIFEPFGQADASPSRRTGGTGLGLYITRQLVRAMGGEVVCDSAPGRGSTFTVTMPALQVPASALSTPAPTPAPTPSFAPGPGSGPSAATAAEAVPVSAPTPSPASADLGPAPPAPSPHTVAPRADAPHVASPLAEPATVLLAEDNEVNALVAVAFLERVGLRVERVDNGRAVIERLCTAGPRPQAVLLDCQMPEVDGYDAARAVRRYERAQQLAPVPIIALTANVFPQDRDQCLAAGMTGFLGKPFTEQELLAELGRYQVGPMAGQAQAPGAGHPALGPMRL